MKAATSGDPTVVGGAARRSTRREIERWLLAHGAEWRTFELHPLRLDVPTNGDGELWRAANGLAVLSSADLLT